MIPRDEDEASRGWLDQGRDAHRAKSTAETDRLPVVGRPSVVKRIRAWWHLLRVQRQLRRQYRDDCRRLLYQRKIEDLIDRCPSAQRCRDLNNLLGD